MDMRRASERCRLCFSQVTEFINIFDDHESVENIVDTLKQHFNDEVSDSDILPKIICTKCWEKVEAFRKFCVKVIALRQEYLNQHFNNVVKLENTDECGDPNGEPEYHREMVCVDTLTSIKMEVEGEDENIEMGENQSMGVNGFFNANDDDDEFYDDLFECNAEDTLASKYPEHSVGIRLPNRISDVTPEQRQQIVQQYFDMTCDFCNATFQTFQDAIKHYELKHDNQPKGYVKCCQLKLTQPTYFYSHIVWHLNPEVFKCNICGTVETTHQAYAYHKYKHLNQFTCDICQMKFPKKYELERHILGVHVSKLKFPCDQCDESFRNEKELRMHCEVIHSNGLEDYIQEIKGLEFNIGEEQVKSIMETFFDRKCDLCDAVFDNLKMAKTHYLSEHNKNGYLKCCSHRIFFNAAVLDHVQYHINPDTFRCRLCKLVKKSRFTLTEHVKKHKDAASKRYSCNNCNQCFESSKLRREHMKHSHSDANDDKSKFPDNVNAFCVLCLTTKFNSFKDVKSHYADIHNTTMIDVQCCEKKFLHFYKFRDHIAWHNKPDSFRCNICNKLMPSRSSLTQHYHLHSNLEHRCDICQKTYSSKSTLAKHMQSHKNLERNLVCDVCNKGFSQKRYLDIHRKRHNQTRDHICEFCGKKFKTKPEVKVHIQKVHSAEPKERKRNFQCDICLGWYGSKGNLKSHKIIHTTQPQECDQCGNIYPNQTALEQHIRVVHSDLNFKCHLCDKSLRSQGALRDHIATHTNKKSHKCTYCDESFNCRPNMYKHQKQVHEKEWLADKAKQEATKMKTHLVETQSRNCFF